MQAELAEDRRVHSTGAVRSNDADGVRFDLVSPIAFKKVLARAKVGGDGNQYKRDAKSLIEDAVIQCYSALGGEWTEFYLEDAAINILEAIRLEVTGEPLQVSTPRGLSYCGLARLAETYKEGADKYGDHNWLKGFPVSDLMNHALRHLLMWLDGDRSDSHLPHAAWGVFAAIHSYEKWPHLNAGKLLMADGKVAEVV